jgi:cell wall-associated NlpC family hydrolase
MDMKSTALALSLMCLACVPAYADGDVNSQQRELPDNVADNLRSGTSELIGQAIGFLGINYKYGGDSPETGFDCSGFVSHVFKEAAGVILPHNAYQMSLSSKKISTRQLQPGDLVFYNTLRRAFSHVGIYVGDDRFIHAPSKGKAVEIADMKDSYWAKRFQGAWRVPQLEQEANLQAQQIALQSNPDSRRAEISALLY